MKQGDEIVCPNCKQSSFLVKKTKMDGWTRTGEYLACSACEFQIEEIKETPPDTRESGTDKNLDKLKSFLDTDDASADYKKLLDSEKQAKKQFCRDCKHFISHPFLNRCGLQKKDINPMDDCPGFTSRDLKK